MIHTATTADRAAAITRFTYGTTRLGDGSIPFAERVAIARAAIAAGVWLHTCHTYGDALHVLRAAFDEDRARIPPRMFKIGWDSIAQLRAVIRQNLEPLGLRRMAIGQLCLGGALAEELRTGGACYHELRRIRDEGGPRALCLRFGRGTRTWRWMRCAVATATGCPTAISSPSIRCSAACRMSCSICCVSAICRSSRCGRSVAVRCSFARRAGLSARPGSAGRATARAIGATSRPDQLDELLDATRDPVPLPDDIEAALHQLQRGWYDQHDRFAEPWSM